MFDWEYGIALHAMQGIEAHFPGSLMSHTISRVAGGTWGIYASYNGDGHSELHFASEVRIPV